MELKPCMVWTHKNKELCEEVLRMAQEAGFRPYKADMPRLEEVYVFGRWSGHVKPTNIYQSSRWDSSIWDQHPDWTRYDSATDMEKIRAHFSVEPEFDETPIPHDMTKEKAEEVQKKFNLSPEQWEVMPPSVRSALDVAKVTIKRVEAKWNPMDKPKPNPGTVLVVKGEVLDAANSAGLCGIGYFHGENYVRVFGTENPTYWTEVPV